VPTAATDYGFEYSDEEQEEEDVDIENQYYNSKGEAVGSVSGAACARVARFAVACAPRASPASGCVTRAAAAVLWL
jgi:hypothetical protein